MGRLENLLNFGSLTFHRMVCMLWYQQKSRKRVGLIMKNLYFLHYAYQQKWYDTEKANIIMLQSILYGTTFFPLFYSCRCFIFFLAGFISFQIHIFIRLLVFLQCAEKGRDKKLLQQKYIFFSRIQLGRSSIILHLSLQ